MLRPFALFAALLAPLALAACSSGAVDDGVVDVAYIGEEDGLYAEGLRLPDSGQHLRAAVAQGLVRSDAQGDVVPGIAERWIVTDDGASYIFRIREFDLPDGSRLTARAVRNALARAMAGLEGTSLGLDLAKIRDIRAMTGRVIEIRLHSPMPDLLQVLAQPELGLELEATPTGPMALTRDGETASLAALAPQLRGLPEQSDWDDLVREVRVTAMPARAATEGFSDGIYDLVLGGRIADLPLADMGPLARGTIRIDGAIGLFGLDVLGEGAFLAERANREALAQAIDRDTLMQAFNIGGWLPTTRIVPPALAPLPGAAVERWAGLTIDQRRARASAIIAAWESQTGSEASVSIALPQGPGAARLFNELAQDLAAIGVAARRAEPGENGDLVLRDRVARYGNARWFLNQFACPVSPRVCSPDADFLVGLAVDAANGAEEASYLAEAEATLLAANRFIPLGAPVRWSLVRADVVGFTENPWARHPLFALSRAPM